MEQAKETVSFAIVQVCRTHRHQAEVALNQLGLHTGQEGLLMNLWSEDGITQSQLAEKMAIQPPTLTKMLSRMEQKGWLVRHQDGEDARISRVYLTPEGHALQKPVMQMWENLEAQTIKGLTLPEQLILRRLLLQMHSNLAEVTPTNCGDDLDLPK